MPAAAAQEGLLSTQSQTELVQLARGLSRDQLLWASGFLAGIAQVEPAGASEASAASTITVLYASQTGNGRRVAESLAAQLKGRGAVVNLASMAEYRRQELARETQLIAVVSTHGEGDPPDAAMPLFKFLSSARAPKLEGLKYAVLALGDSSYEHYCKAGHDFDERLAALGATRLLDRRDCDVDFKADAEAWGSAVLDVVELEARATPASNVISLPTRAPQHDRDRPFAAEVLEVQSITGRGSRSDTYHVELSLEGSGLVYQAGDALGVWPRNPDAVVLPLIEAVGIDPGAQVDVEDRSMTIDAALRDHLEVTQLDAKAPARWTEEAGAWFDGLAAEQRREVLNTWQWIDLIERFPSNVDPAGLVARMRPVTPRLYSIASAPALYEDEVHLSVAALRYRHKDQERFGAASHYLAGLTDADKARVYVEPNAAFRLPEDPATPIIMVGAGTGIAPFRAFVDQRVATDATGENWLIFGHRHLRTDFLYQLEWLRHLKEGHLARLDVAFSRDHAEKRYVQHVVAEHAEDIAARLKDGAHLYVCGSIAMGHAVQETLRAAAPDLLDQAQEQARLHRDLY